ncbi:hypothetical protein SEA_STEVIEBAY_55 [Arthrobacter phage StevieBAY]|uniref:Uncharacterized protein n=1 Tax=Arthrobacter phage StevieBAY TaxID=2725609 RepID=A0A6M3T534_9CAUD|nr:hypothetical protein SEA_STEVIEBAY_55 [Arthrobacter phage StevieBAY]
MTAIYEALRAEQNAAVQKTEREQAREQKLIEFISVAEKFTDVCRLLTQGEQLLVDVSEINVAEDASVVQLVHVFTDGRGAQYIARGDFEGDAVPPFDALLLGAAEAVRVVASNAGLLDLEERLTL